MALSPNSAPVAQNQPNSCTACGCTVSKRCFTGFCRRCFGKQAKHKRCGGIKDSDRMRIVSRARLAWCPVDLLPDYRRMTRIDGMRAKEARKIIEQHMAVQAARYWGKAA